MASSRTKPKPRPKATRGAKFAAEVRAAYELNESQELLVDEITDTLDIIDATTDVIERRQQRVILLRAIAALALPDAGDTTGKRPTSTSVKASRAARARWAREVE
jgi:hypothetical protein